MNHSFMHSFIFILLLLLLSSSSSSSSFCKRCFGHVQTGLFLDIHFCWCLAPVMTLYFKGDWPLTLGPHTSLWQTVQSKKVSCTWEERRAEARRFPGSLLGKQLSDPRGSQGAVVCWLNPSSTRALCRWLLLTAFGNRVINMLLMFYKSSFCPNPTISGFNQHLCVL